MPKVEKATNCAKNPTTVTGNISPAYRAGIGRGERRGAGRGEGEKGRLLWQMAARRKCNENKCG